MHIAYELLPKEQRKSLPEGAEQLPFGRLRTDHMFLMDYSDGEWHNARIVPYGPISMMPGATCFHYGQTIFEGAKAFRHSDGEIHVFRCDQNALRMNQSAEIMTMPSIPAEIQEEALLRLLDVERDWCPSIPESSLYIRPFMFATEDLLGIRSSEQYIFCIMLSPSGPYYGGAAEPITLLISKKFHRAAPGGTGAAKCGGNYAASLRAANFAYSLKASQVLYLSTDNTIVEEAGSMNHFHVLADGTFVIPNFSDTILRSITSLSVLELAAAGRIKARQETVYLDDFIKGVKSGEITEAGGFGTAAVISPVNRYIFEDGSEPLIVGNGKVGEHSMDLYRYYTDVQNGRAPAPEGWLRKVPRF